MGLLSFFQRRPKEASSQPETRFLVVVSTITEIICLPQLVKDRHDVRVIAATSPSQVIGAPPCSVVVVMPGVDLQRRCREGRMEDLLRQRQMMFEAPVFLDLSGTARQVDTQ